MRERIRPPHLRSILPNSGFSGITTQQNRISPHFALILMGKEILSDTRVLPAPIKIRFLNKVCFFAMIFRRIRPLLLCRAQEERHEHLRVAKFTRIKHVFCGKVMKIPP